jgi:hypothetical protein
MARRTIWQIDMGDGTWAVTCMGCRTPLYRGPQRRAARIANRHTCSRGGGR